jgi:hypothetical protein
MSVIALMLSGVDDASTVQDWLDDNPTAVIKHIQIDSAVCWIFYE